MLRVALRGLMGRRMRLLLTALAISLGVAFVSGTYVLTDTMNFAFNDLFGRISAKTDVVVKSQSEISDSMMQQLERKTVPQNALDTVKEVPGVLAAQGSVSGFAQIVDGKGKAITTTGAPTFGISNSSVPELATWTLKDGRAPYGFDEMAVDKHTADANKLVIGKQYKVLFQGPPRTFTLVGTFGFGDLDSLAGATAAVFDLPTAQVVLEKPNAFDSIEVRAEPGVSPDTLRDRIATVLGPAYDVATGATDADRTAKSITDAMAFFSTGMLIFAGVALFVGAFIIINTFSIIVAQRVREFGLLRALGASGRQVVMSVVLEALIIGALSSVAGLVMGLGVAKLLFAAFSALGIDIPSASLQVETRTILVAIGVGIGVTVAASLIPALRAGRVPPIAALQAGYGSAEDRVTRRRVVVGVLVTAAGLASLLFGMYATISSRILPILAGAVVLFVGAASLSGLVARPMAAAIGWPVVRLFHVPAKLGRANAMRSPSRTARTAGALMVGLALVTFVSVFGASMKASASSSIDSVLRADYLVTGASAVQAGFSPEVVRSLEGVRQVQTVAEIRAGNWERNGHTETVGGAVPLLLNDVLKLERIDGDTVHMGITDVLVSQTAARDQGLHVGDTISVWMPVSGQQKLWVSGIYALQGVNVDYLVSLPMFQEGFTQQLDVMVAVKLRDGVSAVQARPAIDAALAAYPNVKLQDSAQFKADQEDQINQILNMMYMLLVLAVVIALFGIVNTLALSVFERVRELGLLRAVGMTRSDVRAMVRWEAVIVSLIGAVLGIAFGCLFGFMAVRAVPSLNTFAIPTVQLVVFVVAAAVAGVLAAIAPARRAAKVDVLKAIATT